jgi:glutamate/tyrosine decarboxylase-like PLP-dependent enzyme
MDQKQMFKPMIEFNKAAFNNAFDITALVQDQFEKAANTALDQTNWLPAEGRKAIESWAELFRVGRKNFKQQMDNGFEQAEKLFIS